MKNLTVKAVDTVLYAACGALLLWAARDQETGFYILVGACLLALAAWEGWTWVRDCRAGRNEKCAWIPSMTVAFILVAVRQIVFPLAVLAVLRLLGVDELTTRISVVITGMPIGSTTAILADKYNANAAFASKCVFISTVTSLVTIPVLTLFL